MKMKVYKDGVLNISVDMEDENVKYLPPDDDGDE